jgi:hypothetical protein
MNRPSTASARPAPPSQPHRQRGGRELKEREAFKDRQNHPCARTAIAATVLIASKGVARTRRELLPAGRCIFDRKGRGYEQTHWATGSRRAGRSAGGRRRDRAGRHHRPGERRRHNRLLHQRRGQWLTRHSSPGRRHDLSEGHVGNLMGRAGAARSTRGDWTSRTSRTSGSDRACWPGGSDRTSRASRASRSNRATGSPRR